MRNIALLLPAIGIFWAIGCDCGDDAGGTEGEGEGEGEGDSGAWDDTDGGAIQVRDGGVEITDDGGSFVCYVTVCDGHTTECGDCVDNDEDGRVDWRDRECLGPCDNTEGPQLTTGVGGEGGTSCNRDCYFDYGNGSGNDECVWDTFCDPLAPDDECPYEPDEVGGRDCPPTQVAPCLEKCRPVTPNGCDCFGCCTFDALQGRSDDDGGEWIWLGSGVGEGPDGEGTCTFDLLSDTSACHPCIPVADCFNDCGHCELCLGRDELPPDCTEGDEPDGGPGGSDAGAGARDGGAPGERCDPGVQVCGLPGEPDCPAEFYCITGCCQPILF